MGDVTSIGQDPATTAQYELVAAIKATGLFGDGLRQETSNGHEFMFHCPICIEDDDKGDGHRPHLRIARSNTTGRTIPFVGCRTHDSNSDFVRIRKALLSAGIAAELLGTEDDKRPKPVRATGMAGLQHAEFRSRPEGLGEKHPIPEGRIQRWCATLWEGTDDAIRTRAYLARRGLTDDVIVAAEFGLAGNRLILPMRGADGSVVAARYRVLDKKGNASAWKPYPHPKLRKTLPDGSTKPETYGAPTRLYGARELAVELDAGSERPAWVAAGEFDRLTLLGAGCLAVSPTNGEGSLPRLEDAELLLGREVIIVFDCDKAGRRGALKLAVALLKLGADAVRVLDLDPDRDDGYDVSDFFAEYDKEDGTFDAMQLLSDKAALTPLFSMEDIADIVAEAGLPVTDTEAAEFLLRRHDMEMLFVDTGRARSGHWIVWDKNRWRRDADGIVERWVAELGREYLPAAREAYLAARASEDGSAGALSDLRRIERLLDDGKITSVLSRARTVKPGITIDPGVLDENDRILVVGNGVLELLDDGVKLRPGKQSDMATQSTGVFYDAKAKAAAWDDFLRTFLPDAELREFVGRALGYCLLGRNPDGMVFHFMGKTRTGKSTLLRAVSRALGDYAKPFDLTALRGKFETGPREDIADIMTARIAYVSELSSAWELHADQMKRLTGMDKISYNRKWESQQTKYPDFTAVLAANGMPRIKGADAALRGRFITVPFLQSVARRSQKAEQLENDVAAEAVLAWLVRGYRRYCKYGIQWESWPGAVIEATSGAHALMDDIDEFIQDCCETGNEYWAPAAVFYPAYRHWCEDSGISRSDVQKRQLFAESLTDRGYVARNKKVDGAAVKVRLGIKLNPGYAAMSFG